MAEICVYVTHGGIALKGLAHSYKRKYPEEEQIIVQYNSDKLTFDITTKSKADPAIKTTNSHSYDKFITLCTSENKVFRLCCDANLGASNANTVISTEGKLQIVDALVHALKPKELVLFSDTPDCLRNVREEYLPNLTERSVERAIAVPRKHFFQLIIDGIPDITFFKTGPTKSQLDENSTIAIRSLPTFEIHVKPKVSIKSKHQYASLKANETTSLVQRFCKMLALDRLSFTCSRSIHPAEQESKTDLDTFLSNEVKRKPR